MWLHFSNVVVIFRPVINLSFFFSIAKHLCTSLLAKRGSQGGGGGEKKEILNPFGGGEGQVMGEKKKKN